MAVAGFFFFGSPPYPYPKNENSPPPWVFFCSPPPWKNFLSSCWNFGGAHVCLSGSVAHFSKSTYIQGPILRHKRRPAILKNGLGSVLCLNVVFGSIFPCLSFGALVFHYSVFHYSVFRASVFRYSVFRSPKGRRWKEVGGWDQGERRWPNQMVISIINMLL